MHIQIIKINVSPHEPSKYSHAHNEIVEKSELSLNRNLFVPKF